MNFRSIKKAFVAAVGILTLSGLSHGASYEHLANRKPKTIEEAPNLGGLSERVYKRLAKAQTLLAEEKFKDALELLTLLEESTRNTPFAYAQVLQTKGFVYAQMNKYDEALVNLKKSIELNSMPLRGTLSSMMTTAQLYMAKEKFEDAIPLIQDVIFNSEVKNSRHYVALAQCFAALKVFHPAIAAIRTAIKMEPEPKETWYQLYVAMNYSIQDYKAAVEGLETLIQINPDKKKYWQQLSSLYLAQSRDREALAAMELAYKKGYLTTEKELLHLFSLMYHTEVPWKAARLMEKAFADGKIAKNKKNYEMLSNFWQRSQELDEALASLAKAAPLATDGKVFVRQGNIYLAKESWSEARTAFEKGIAKGNLTKPGSVFLSLGISQYKLQNIKGAFEAFKKASGFPKAKDQAEQWIAHMESEGHKI